MAADPEFAIAAAIAIAGGLIGTGMAQQGIGAAGMGIIAERPEKFGQVLFFFVIPRNPLDNRLRARPDIAPADTLNRPSA